MSKSFKQSTKDVFKAPKKRGIDSLIGDQPKPNRVGRPKTSTREIYKSSQDGTKEGESRATFIVKEELIEKLKASAYWSHKQIKDVVNEALAEYIKKAKVKPRPIEARQRDQENSQKLMSKDKKAKLPKY